MNLDSPNNPHDIVPYLNPTEMDKTVFMSKGYPQKASFQFYGFEGIAMKNDLVNELKKAALKGGTPLNFRSRGKMSTHRSHTIEITCGKHLMSKSSKSSYKEDCIQQCGTIIQPKHQKSSVKGSSRSSWLKHVSYSTSTCDTGIKSNKYRHSTKRPVDLEKKCPFMFYVFLSSNDDKWYLSYSATSNTRMCHQHHFKMPDYGITHNYGDLSPGIRKYVHDALSNHIDGPSIVQMVFSQYGVNITLNTIKVARKEYINKIFNEYSVDPANSSCDRLLGYFRSNMDISFLSVTHSVDSGFVTFRRSKCPKNSVMITEEEKDVEAQTISSDDMERWRSDLKVKDGKEILVALAWIHQDDMRNVTLFPEVLSVDVTFGVNKQSRNLLRVCGIDGNFKVFTAFQCFMPSKQFRAFDWVCRVAFPKLVGNEVLRYNTVVTSDQESPLTSGIRNLMEAREYPLGRSVHRLDMYHIFVKEWKDKVRRFFFHK